MNIEEAQTTILMVLLSERLHYAPLMRTRQDGGFEVETPRHVYTKVCKGTRVKSDSMAKLACPVCIHQIEVAHFSWEGKDCPNCHHHVSKTDWWKVTQRQAP